MVRTLLLLLVLGCLTRSGAYVARRARSFSAARPAPRTSRVTPVMMPQGTPQVPYQGPGMDAPAFVDIYQYLYRNRIMLVGSFIDEEVSNQIIATLLWLKTQEPKEKPITIYFNVAGCLLSPGLAVFDTIKDVQSTTTVNTLNIGLAVGMSAILCAAGDLRMALPNARYLLQETGKEDPVSGQAIDVALEVAQCQSANRNLALELSKLTGQPLPKIEKDLKRDFYLDAAEAVQYGLIDQVLLPKKRTRRKRTYEATLDSAQGVARDFQDIIGYGVFADANDRGLGLSGPGSYVPPTPGGGGPNPMMGMSNSQIGNMLLDLNGEVLSSSKTDNGDGGDGNDAGAGGADGNVITKFDKNGPYPDEGPQLLM